MTYDQALAAIAALEPRGWRLGLDRMQAFVERAGLSAFVAGREETRFLHVAGTNGKGSVTAYLQSIMVEAGHRTGAFFSPYVVDPRERVQLGRELIEPERFARLTAELMPIGDALEATEFGGVTEFEFKTALGFACWREAGCRWVALEVGLGGRLDATNVVTPAAGCIVSIGLDHTHILGETHALIAREKAGIAKPGVPLVVGEMVPEAREAIEAAAVEVGAPLWRMGVEVALEPDGEGWRVATPARTVAGLRPSLLGSVQPHNMAVAVATAIAGGLEADDAALRRGVERAALPGRMQRMRVRDREVLLDGAHNLESAEALVASVEALYGRNRRIVLVTNMLAGHDVARFMEIVAPLAAEAHVVPIDFHRAQPVEQAASFLSSRVPHVVPHARLPEGLSAALEAAGRDDLVLVTGSFYLVGEVIRSLDAVFSTSAR